MSPTRVSLFLSTAAGVLLAASAFAQAPADETDPAAEAPVAATSAVDEQVTVYGQKSRRTLQDTQASVSVVTAREIEDKDIQNFRDAFRLMGNVIDADWVDAGFVLRGVNSEGMTPGGAPLASIYIDGAAQTVQGARRGARGLWDVQQVEVYRGPQSTLSGRASLAGAVYIKTKDPTFDWDARMRATIGSMETREGAVAFGGPLVDDILAFRIAAEYQTRTNDLSYPLYERYSRFENFIEDEYWQVRGKLLFKPQGLGGTEIVLGYSFSHDSPIYDDIAGPGLGFPYSARRGDLNAGTPYYQEAREADNQTFSLNVAVPLSDRLELTSITSWAQTDLSVPSINEGTPGETLVTQGGQDQSLWTQEFRVNYDNADTGLRWVFGLYFASDDQDTNQRRALGSRVDSTRVSNEVFNAAAFGEVTFLLAPEWEAVAGARIDYAKTDRSYLFIRDWADPARPDVYRSGVSESSETTFLPKVGLVWKYDPGHSLGLTVQRGFRPGGAGVNTSTGNGYDYEAEYTWNYELSYRSLWLDGALSVNANVFYTDWTDQQVELQLIPGDFTSAVVLNAGKSHLYGAELESRYRPVDGLELFLSVGYLETKFDEFTSTIGDYSGFEFPEAPRWTLAFGFEYEHPSGFFIGFDGRKISSYLARDIQNAPADYVGDYFVGNARIGYRAENWTVTLFSDNVFDEEYFVYRDVIGTFDCCATLGNRRVTGVTLTAKY